MNKLPISAVIVSYNEGHFLEACLKPLDFCDEIIVFDLQSTDDTKEIAEKYATKVISHERVPVVEIIHAKLSSYVNNDWVLITDPDEVLRAELKKQIIENFNTNINTEKIGAVVAPMRYYFSNHLLKGTIWGGIQSRIYLVNLQKFNFSSEVHRGRSLKDEFELYKLKFKNHNYIEHFWIPNYKQLITKHKRYIKKEGESRYSRGLRTSRKQIIYSLYKDFKNCFYYKRGYKDGFTGLFLSFFWTWYEAQSKLSLLKYQKQHNAQS